MSNDDQLREQTANAPRALELTHRSLFGSGCSATLRSQDRGETKPTHRQPQPMSKRANRLIAFASVAAFLAMTGCTSLSSPVPVHPVAAFQERLGDFADGVALEEGQSRVEGDTTQLRLQTAHARASTPFAPLAQRWHAYVNSPRPW